MGFCTEQQVETFLELAPAVERTFVEGGIILLKYFLDVSEEEQEKRFQRRVE